MPLVLLAGFLGAGKTRFLTELIPLLTARDVRVRVILNDFENARIDAARLGALEALVTPLNGECVCCGSLRELLDQLYAVPAESGSVMLIEANGATETDELLGHLTADARLAPYTLPLQLAVVDASRWQKRWWHNGLERAQVATATHVHCNWTAQLTDARVAAVQASVRQVNNAAPLVSASEFADLLQSLADHARAPQATRDLGLLARDARVGHAPSVAGHAHPFGSVSLPLPSTVDRAAFLAFVQSLPAGVVRAKGLVRFANETAPMYVWNRVPGRRRVSLDESWPHADAEPTALFIGVQLDACALQTQITRLVG